MYIPIFLYIGGIGVHQGIMTLKILMFQITIALAIVSK